MLDIVYILSDFKNSLHPRVAVQATSSHSRDRGSFSRWCWLHPGGLAKDHRIAEEGAGKRDQISHNKPDIVMVQHVNQTI